MRLSFPSVSFLWCPICPRGEDQRSKSCCPQPLHGAFLNLLIPYSYTWAWSPSLKPRGIFFPVLVAALPSFGTPPSNSWFSSCLSLQTPPISNHSARPFKRNPDSTPKFVLFLIGQVVKVSMGYPNPKPLIFFPRLGSKCISKYRIAGLSGWMGKKQNHLLSRVHAIFCVAFPVWLG